MKLRNKKTGEILEHALLSSYGVTGDVAVEFMDENAESGYSEYATYHSLAELNEEWEDCEELKEYWLITWCGEVDKETDDGTDVDNECKEIGNYFETEEEAEKAVEKLKAWKRLKDKGFRFIGKTYETDKRFGSIFYKVDDDTYSEDIIDDLDLLFGGEE